MNFWTKMCPIKRSSKKAIIDGYFNGYTGTEAGGFREVQGGYKIDSQMIRVLD